MNRTCERHRDSLLRRACGEQLPAVDARLLAEHIAGCERCRDEVAETAALMQTLVEALQPTPLPPALERRIVALLAERARGGGRHGGRIASLPIPRFVAAAAAACLLLAAVPRWGELGPFEHHDGGAAAFALSHDDAAEIVAALSLLRWTTPLELAVEQTSARLEELERYMEEAPGAQSVLPWPVEENWDLPPADEQQPSSARPANRSVTL